MLTAARDEVRLFGVSASQAAPDLLGARAGTSLFPEPGPDLDFAGERSVHRALVGDLKQALALAVIECSGELDDSRDLIELAFFRLAVTCSPEDPSVDMRVRQQETDDEEEPVQRGAGDRCAGEQ